MPAKKYHFAEDQIEAVVASMTEDEKRHVVIAYAKRLLCNRICRRSQTGYRRWRPGSKGRTPTEMRAKS